MTQNTLNDQVAHLFRRSYSNILSVLVAKYGIEEMVEIENAIMEAFYKALRTWPSQGIPDNPAGWLYRTSVNSLLDYYKKKNRPQKDIPRDSEVSIDENIILNANEIHDPQLQMLFAVCHPSLKKEDQLAFMLKTMSGLGNREIAAALLQKESTIKKRIARARKNIISEKISFDLPGPKELPSRLDMVHRGLYLFFNEGYYANNPNFSIRKELCFEAMRLCKAISEKPIATEDTFALLALMCYHISRFESRIDENDKLISLKYQDRSKWDPFFIKLGHHYIEKSTAFSNDKSNYQIEAAISAIHCTSESLESTNWDLLEVLYRKLLNNTGNIIVQLNLIIVYIMQDKLEEAKLSFESLDKEEFKNHLSYYYMVGVELYSKLQDQFQTKLWIELALQHPDKLSTRTLEELKSFSKSNN